MDKVCFVVCPIEEEGSDTRKNSDQLLKYILQPVCEECGFNCIRVDELNDNDAITETIIRFLNEADLVIADLSEHNPNAFYELGYRSALKKPIIHVKNEVDKIPFDVAGIRTITYNLTDLPKVEETQNRLKKTIQNLKYDNQKSNTDNDSDYNVLLTEVFKIQDELRNLRLSLGAQNNTAVSILADKISTTSLSPEVAMIQSMFSLFKDPEIRDAFIRSMNETQKEESISDSIPSSNS